MSNTVKIKRGSGAPTTSEIAAYELAYDYTNNKLYIHDGDSSSIVEITGTDTNTTYTGGTNLTLSGTTFNVDDAFLKNDANDTTSGTITAAGFTTAGNLTLGGHAVNDIDIGSEFVDADDHLMTSGAIKEKIESYSYLTSVPNHSANLLTSGTVPLARISDLTTDNIASDAAIEASKIGVLPASKITSGELATARVNFDSTDKTVRWDNGRGYHGNPRSMAIGYSGGNYGQFGYGLDFTTTSGEHTYAINDIATRVDLYDGIMVYTSDSGGSVGSTISWTELLDCRGHIFQYKNTNIALEGTLVLGGHTMNDIDIGSEFVDTDDHLMTSGAIKEKIEAYGYVTSAGISHDGSTADGVLTYKDADEATVESNLTFNGSTLTLDGSNDGNRNIEIGSGGSGTAFVDLIASDTYTDYSLRLIRWSGDNATSDLTHRGTGDLRFITSDAANILWLTGGAEKMRMVHSTGNLGIGTNSPTQKLDVAGHAHIEGNIYFGDDSVWQLDDTSWTGGSANQANIMLTGASGWFGFHGDSSNTVSIIADGDIRALGHMRVANNEGYYQYDAAGNIALIANLDSGDALRIGDATHVEQIAISTAQQTNAMIFNTSGSISMSGNVTMSSPLTVNYGAVFNESSHDSDFRVESNGYANAFKVDAGSDRVDIGVSHKAEYGMRLDGLNRTGGNASSHHLTSWHNILTYSDNTNMAGSIIINTDITRASARMCSIHVVGYAYGASKAIDFTISFYTYSGVNGQDGVAGYPYAASLVDRGTDGFNKYVGVNSSGNIAIAIGDHDSGNKYYYGFKVTRDNHLNSTGHSAYSSWTTGSSTTDGFGWLDKRSPTHYLNRGMTYDQTYTKILDPSGSVKAWFGDSGDENNYYNGGQHIFRAANSTEYLRITSGHISNTSGGDFHLRRDTSNDDMIEINASDTRIYGDANERMRIGSIVRCYKPFYVKTTSSSAEMRFYHEDGTGNIADSFADTTTDKSYINFQAGDSSNDPGYIMHETSDSETNEGVIHICPSDDNADSDYVSIHGTNDADSLKLSTSGKIEGVSTISADDGSAGAPSYTNNGDNNTGMYFPAADNIGFSVNGGEVVRIDGSGLGVGITPAETLDLKTSSGDCRIRMDAPDGSDCEIKFYNDGTVQYTMGYDDGADEFRIGTSNVDSGVRFKLTDNGVNIADGGLGVDVAPSTTDGRIDAANDVVAYSTSDKRLKENIKPLDNALDKVMQISGVEFDWKKLTEKEKETIHGNEGHDVGVIAQEVEEVLPEVVTQRDSGYKAVKYEKIVPLLIEAIKELKQEIQELKNG
jgi:hypothetical protein